MDKAGKNNGNAKLTDEQVMKIRKDQRIQKVIAYDYGISQSQVCLIKRRESWRHI